MHDPLIILNNNTIPLIVSMVMLISTIAMLLGYYFYIEKKTVLLFFFGVESMFFLHSMFYALMIEGKTEAEVLFYGRWLYTFLMYSVSAIAYMVDYITEEKGRSFGRISLLISSVFVIFLWFDNHWILREKIVYHFHNTPEKGPGILLMLLYSLLIGILLIRRIHLHRREISREAYMVIRPLLYAVMFFVFHTSLVGVVSVIYPVIKPMNHISIFFTTLMIGLYFYNDVRYHIRLKDQMHEAYMKDSLTGVYSRDYIISELERVIGGEGDRSHFIAFMDMDSFKDINDRYGHLAGDRVLQCFGDIMSKMMETNLVIGRLGGDEFLFIFRDTNRQRVADRLMWLTKDYMQLLDELGMDIAGRNISVGVVRFAPGKEMTDLLEQADRIMYEAKASDHNNVVFFA